MRNAMHIVLLVLTSTACIETGQDRVEIPLRVGGTQIEDPVQTRGDVPVTILRADLAFGPLYLCAGTNSGDLCDTARLEWLDSIVIDTLMPESVEAGVLTGVSGPVRSWMYDLGISSQLTSPHPDVLEAAEALGSVSLLLEGQAQIDGIIVPFSAAVPIQQTGDTELGVPVVRKSTSDVFEHDVTGQEASLTVHFDPSNWVRGLDLRRLVDDAQCTPDAQSVVCNGTIELSCVESEESSRRDCADTNQICQTGVGCTDVIVIERDSQPYRSLRNALLSGVRPTFTWDRLDPVHNGARN